MGLLTFRILTRTSELPLIVSTASFTYLLLYYYCSIHHTYRHHLLIMRHEAMRLECAMNCFFDQKTIYFGIPKWTRVLYAARAAILTKF